MNIFGWYAGVISVGYVALAVAFFALLLKNPGPVSLNIVFQAGAAAIFLVIGGAVFFSLWQKFVGGGGVPLSPGQWAYCGFLFCILLGYYAARYVYDWRQTRQVMELQQQRFAEARAMITGKDWRQFAQFLNRTVDGTQDVQDIREIVAPSDLADGKLFLAMLENTRLSCENLYATKRSSSNLVAALYRGWAEQVAYDPQQLDYLYRQRHRIMMIMGSSDALAAARESLQRQNPAFQEAVAAVNDRRRVEILAEVKQKQPERYNQPTVECGSVLFNALIAGPFSGIYLINSPGAADQVRAQYAAYRAAGFTLTDEETDDPTLAALLKKYDMK